MPHFYTDLHQLEVSFQVHSSIHAAFIKHVPSLNHDPHERYAVTKYSELWIKTGCLISRAPICPRSPPLCFFFFYLTVPCFYVMEMTCLASPMIWSDWRHRARSPRRPTSWWSINIVIEMGTVYKSSTVYLNMFFAAGKYILKASGDM